MKYNKKKELKREQRYLRRVDKLVDISWWHMDSTIALVVAKTCDKYIEGRHGMVNPQGWDFSEKYDDELLDACTGYTYEVLKELAEGWRDESGAADNGFPGALAEAIRLGYLWD